MNRLENTFDGKLFMKMQNLSLPCQMNRRLSLNALLDCPLTLFSPLISGCSSKFGLSHSHSNSQLFHAHGNHKWPVPEVTAFFWQHHNLFPVWHGDVWRCLEMYSPQNDKFLFEPPQRKLRMACKSHQLGKIHSHSKSGCHPQGNCGDNIMENHKNSQNIPGCPLKCEHAVFHRAMRKRRCSWWPPTCPKTPPLAQHTRRVEACTRWDSFTPTMVGTLLTTCWVSSRMPAMTWVFWC